MSPKLLQSISMMALPLPDLRQAITAEVEKNPALEIEADRSEVSLTPLEPSGEDYDFFENSSDPGYVGDKTKEDSDSKQKFLEGTTSRSESLQDHLLFQWGLQDLSLREKVLGEKIIQNLDSDGFHQEPPQSLIQSEDESPLLEKTLFLIQHLDPLGCATKNPQESLMRQVEFSPHIPAQAKALFTDYYDLTIKGKTRELARKLRISQEETELLLTDIKQLSPYPGRPFSAEEANYVIPDLLIYQQAKEITIRLNDDEIPVLRINEEFLQYQEQGQGDVKKFIRNHIKDATSFINSIQYRNQTLLKVARALAEHQSAFFFKGPKELVPLTMKEVADEISMTEGTISRISNSKYIQTEWGIFPVKFFFSNAVSTSRQNQSPQGLSHNAVREYIKEIIDESPPGKRLSDQKLSDLLKNKGINIARRTVAKYRKELNIESSFNR